MAARIAQIGLDAGWGEAFCKAVYTAQFGEGRRIHDEAVLREIVDRFDDADQIFAAASTPENKACLQDSTDEAIRLGIYGAPSFTVGEEHFWGHDRMDDALAWAAKGEASVAAGA